LNLGHCLQHEIPHFIFDEIIVFMPVILECQPSKGQC
jgi:hypothetical protein